MITEIINNPFRILGLAANARKEEIDQCYQVLMEEMRLQESDISYIKEIKDAYEAVISPENHWHHALFWFVCLTSKDEHALQFVEEGNYRAAINIWEETTNYASSHNLMLCYLLISESAPPYYIKVCSLIRNFFITEDTFNAFVECVGESNKVAEDEAKAFLDIVFSQTTADKATLYAMLGNEVWMNYVRGRWVSTEEADTRYEEVLKWVEITKQAEKNKASEELRYSVLKWIWMLIFPIVLIIYHINKNDQRPKLEDSFAPFQKVIPSQKDKIEISDSAAYIRLKTDIKKMRENKGTDTSLRERINKRIKHD